MHIIQCICIYIYNWIYMWTFQIIFLMNDKMHNICIKVLVRYFIINENYLDCINSYE